MARLNVGVLGLSHDHVWSNLAALAGGELGCLAAVAEPDAQLRARFQGLYGGVPAHEEFEAVLKAVIASDPNTSKPDRLANIVAQRRAKLLLKYADDLFN